MTPRHLLAPARLAGSTLLGTQNDERLVDLCRAGSEPAFEAIVSRYRSPLLRYCSALLGPERAEDVVQQAFVNAHDAMRRDERPLRLRPWLYRIAHNLAHNALRDGALRSRALREEPLGDGGLVADQPDVEVERRERLRAVLASVQELPARQRDALLLRELEGRSYEEIADALGVGGGAVRQLLNRARTTLRTAATAVTPVGLLLRLPGSGTGEPVAARVAELTGAAGAGTVAAKVAATALVTGAVAGGAAVGPLGDTDGQPPRDRPRAVAPAEEAGGAPAPVAPAPAAQGLGSGSGSGASGGDDDGRRGDSSGPGSGDREDRDGSNSGPGSDSSGSGSSGSDSSGSGSDSSDSDSGPGSESSGSGSSGSGPASSGSSGSGSSGSGSSGSGSSGSGSSGSGTSGSGSSGSGSDSSGSGSDSTG
jgi:RNA polymerase sigma factor (sigma-70 family)